MATLAASMAPGTWAQLTTTDIVPTLSATGASGGIFGYNEDAVWDPGTRQFFFVGGDHNDIARFVSYSDDTNTWKIMPKPAWIGTYTMHGYNHHAINAAAGVFYHRPFNSSTIRKYKISTGEWTDLPPFPSNFYNTAAMGLEYFPERGGLVLAGTTQGSVMNAALFFSEATQQWSVLSENVPMGLYHMFAAYNPVHKVVIFGGGNDPGSHKIHKVDAAGTVTTLKDAPIAMGINQTIVTADPVSGDYLIFGGDGSFYVYNVVEDTWTLRPGTLPISTPTRSNAIWHVTATPVGTYGVTMFVKFFFGTPSQAWVYLYKHAAGGGTPPPKPDPGPTPAPAPTPAPPKGKDSNPCGCGSLAPKRGGASVFLVLVAGLCIFAFSKK